MDKELIDTFFELVKIPSPSGNEREVIAYIKNYLKRMGVSSRTDSAGKFVKSNSGNLIAKIGTGAPKLMFAAHVDTVEDGKKQINPQLKGGRIFSDGTTILGADNKAGVTALLCAMKELSKDKNLPGIICVFSVREEIGTMGVRYLGIPKKPEYAFDIDIGDRPGTFINKALGRKPFKIHVYGKEAHAAANVEKGANAIKVAGLIISQLNIGRDSEGGTLNIGRISGGRELNVVPDYALLEGEARAFTTQSLDKKLKVIERIAKASCRATGCRYKFVVDIESADPPFSVSDKRIIKLAKKAASGAGLRFILNTIYATLETNTLYSKGYNVLGLSSGVENSHGPNESVTVKELEQVKRLILEIVNQCRSE